MAINLEEKSIELKKFLSQFETKIFLGDIASLMNFIRAENPIESLKGLTSPQRQLYYIAGLHLSTAVEVGKDIKAQYSNDDWIYIKNMLNDIEAGYLQFFYPNEGEEITEDWISKRTVAMPTFLSYFNQGQLNYEEQIIERITEYFIPLNKEIELHFGLSVSDFISIYNYIDSLPNKFLNEKINQKEGQQTWEEFAQTMIQQGIPPNEWQPYIPQHFNNMFNFLYDHGRINRFTSDDLYENFGVEKSNSFLNALTSSRQETNFLYYTQQNPLHLRPIFKLKDGEYQTIEMKQIVHAIFNSLAEFCKTLPNQGAKFYEIRGVKLENKIVDIFQGIFKSKPIIYQGFYTQDKHEQDILILADNFAFIIEAKASKRDEPRRNPELAYPLILSNFDETIQKGYDQAYRVKEKFITGKPLEIYRDLALQRHEVTIRTKNYHGAFSIIVTLERFGQIQTDLSELLYVYDNDEFPWSVCIDDLEVFLLLLKKRNKRISDFANFLTMREKLHGHLICSDELEVCAAFLEGALTHKLADKEDIIIFPPDISSVFDKVYQTNGLGFKNEKNMEIKASGNYIPIGSNL